MVIFRSMTGITISRRAFKSSVDMAGGTGNVRMFANQGKYSCAVIVKYVLPFCRLVTRSAVRSKLSFVVIFCRVTGITISWRTFESSIHMTGGAGNGCVCISQRKHSFTVVKGYILPAGRDMTTGAVLTKISIVSVIRRMTGKAGFRSVCKNTVHMAGGTCNIYMQTC